MIEKLKAYRNVSVLGTIGHWHFSIILIIHLFVYYAKPTNLKHDSLMFFNLVGRMSYVGSACSTTLEQLAGHWHWHVSTCIQIDGTICCDSLIKLWYTGTCRRVSPTRLTGGIVTSRQVWYLLCLSCSKDVCVCTCIQTVDILIYSGCGSRGSTTEHQEGGVLGTGGTVKGAGRGRVTMGWQRSPATWG